MSTSDRTGGETLEGRYEAVRARVSDAAARSGRGRDGVIVVAVTKHAEPEDIRTLVELGHRDFGENRVQALVQRASMVQEFLARRRVLAGGHREHVSASAESLFSPRPARHGGPVAAPGPTAGVRWHMIGHLQRNKARKVVDLARLIHSVDSLRLAEELQQVALRRDEPVEVLVQVNCSGESSKFGCPVPAALPLAQQIDTMVNVRVRGLMTMGPLGSTRDQARRVFARARELFEELRSAGVSDGQFDILSMGMSGDYEEAILEGANVVRIGSAIFGEPRGPLAPETDD